MARKSASDVSPDLDDVDGQAGSPVIIDGSDGGTATVVDPVALAGNDGGNSGGTDDYVRDAAGNVLRNKDGSPKRKRGRKAGSSNSGSAARATGNSASVKASIDSLSNMLGFLHLGIAGVTKCPEMVLEQSERDSLAGATANVLAQFDLRPDPKVEAIVGLVTTAGTIYGPRMYLISKRRKEERKNAPPPVVGNVDMAGLGGGSVVDFPGAFGAPN